MSADRREFLKTLGGAALAGATAAGPLAGLSQAQENAAIARPRVVVLWEEGFPTINGLNVERGLLEQALGGFDLAFWGEAEAVARLAKEPPALFVHPYGAAFPQRLWHQLHQYLWPGHNWLNLGGVPLSVPVVRNGAGGWRAEIPQVQYHKRFGIYQSFPVEGRQARTWQATGDALRDFSANNTVEECYELYLRLTTTNDYPNEVGTAGQRDAKITTLVFGLDAAGRRVAAPIVQVDRLLGDYAGGRWLWANYKGRISAETVRALAENALQGAWEVVAQPAQACYYEGETPVLNLQLRRPAGGLAHTRADNVSLSLGKVNDGSASAGAMTLQTNLALSGQGAAQQSSYVYRAAQPLTPGLYRVQARVAVPSALSGGSSYQLTQETGFWVYDRALLSSGSPLTTDKHSFYRNGAPFPVTGTTYMASDVHRKFLLEPNPLVWDQDFREMKEAGVNLVRTGLWTAWKNVMLDAGALNETVLRALDAFLLTARKYDIPVIFTFFAFLPEAWGGQNAYLDPRALKAQKQFLAAFANRYREMKDLSWDLINEPSFCNPGRLWSCRPNYDAFEQQAWADWLRARYPAASDEEREAALLERWRATPEDGFGLPRLEEFDSLNIHETRRPLKVIDYKLFAQEQFTRWVREMSETLRGNGSASQLITVGQDEAGAGDSPGAQFHAGAVDYTCLHNWWANDDLLWSGVMTKAPSKPNLVEETGLMFNEKMDGQAWRSEDEAAALLERKMALSLGANGAGFIEWVWNINPFMTLDNEVTIGFYRVAGTAKPELAPFLAIARFAAANRNHFKGKLDEDAVLVIPHTHLFAPRSYAVEATRRAVRAMHYYCQTPLRAVSEYKLDELAGTPKMLLVPSPLALTQNCWSALLAQAEKGATVVITGPIGYDDHWLPAERGAALNLSATRAAVAPSEFLVCDGQELVFRFGGEKMQRLEKDVVGGAATARVIVQARGAGTIVWCPLPIEAGDTTEPVAAFYRYALAQARLTPLFTVTNPTPAVLLRPTLFAKAALYTCVSETGRDTALEFTHHETKTRLSLNLPAQRAALIFLDRASGQVLDSTITTRAVQVPDSKR